MNARERIQATLNRQPVDRRPVDLWYTPEIATALKQFFGIDDEFALYRAMNLDKIVWVFPGYHGPDPDSEALGSSHYGGDRTMWGAPLKTIDTGTAVYQEMRDPPLRTYETIEALDDYPYWPDPSRFDYEAAETLARNAAQEFAVIGPWVSFFEIYCQLRGLDQELMDVMMNPDLVHAILDRIESIQTEMMKRFFEAAGDVVDLVFISDDMGMQENLLVSLDTWDEYFKARMKRWCDLIHSYGIKVFFHSDGAMEPLIPRLIDCGIDVLNPIQHVCPGMDTVALGERYGDQLIFHGGIDNQSVLPFGSVEDVRAETQRCLETLGAGGKGYICCSCHNVQAGTPVENILAMIETVQATPLVE